MQWIFKAVCVAQLKDVHKYTEHVAQYEQKKNSYANQFGSVTANFNLELILEQIISLAFYNKRML